MREVDESRQAPAGAPRMSGNPKMDARGPVALCPGADNVYFTGTGARASHTYCFAAYLLFAGMAVGLVWQFPLFHVIPLDDVIAARQAAQFDAPGFAKEFWDDQLVPGFETATDAFDLFGTMLRDPVAASNRYGRAVGIGRNCLFFLRGEGKVLAVEPSGVAVSCVAPENHVDLVLKTGLLFGSTIRDATGQLKPEDFSNSRDFNAVSHELNRIVEDRVLPLLKQQAAVGDTIRFVGCAEYRANRQESRPLAVVPLHIEFPSTRPPGP